MNFFRKKENDVTPKYRSIQKMKIVRYGDFMDGYIVFSCHLNLIKR